MVQIFNIAYDSIRLMISNVLRRVPAKIHKMDGQLRVQVSSLMKTAFYLCGGKSCFLKNLRVRKEIDAGSGLSGSGKLGEKSLLQLDGRNASLIVVVMHIAVTGAVVALSIGALAVIIAAGVRDRGCRSYGVCAGIALGMMLVGAVGMNLVPAGYFGVVERFSVFAATGFNAALGVHLFCGDSPALSD